MEGNQRARGCAQGLLFPNFFVLMAVLLLAGALAACGGGGNQMSGGHGAAKATRRALSVNDAVVRSDQRLNIAVHYMAFRDAGGAVVDEETIRMSLNEASRLWEQCHIGFKLERFDVIDPSVLGARFSPANYSELDRMRLKAQSPDNLLMIATGPWDRDSGDLGESGSNCYSSFPGDEAQGLVCEYEVAPSAMMMSHESGHWLNLWHTDDPDSDGVSDTVAENAMYNLMSHFVSPENAQLTRGQCMRARQAIAQWRRSAVLPY